MDFEVLANEGSCSLPKSDEIKKQNVITKVPLICRSNKLLACTFIIYMAVEE